MTAYYPGERFARARDRHPAPRQRPALADAQPRLARARTARGVVHRPAVRGGRAGRRGHGGRAHDADLGRHATRRRLLRHGGPRACSSPPARSSSPRLHGRRRGKRRRAHRRGRGHRTRGRHEVPVPRPVRGVDDRRHRAHTARRARAAQRPVDRGARGEPARFWYVRNLVAVGSPLPGVDVQLGPIHIDGPEVAGLSTIADYVFQRRRGASTSCPVSTRRWAGRGGRSPRSSSPEYVIGFTRDRLVRLLSFVAAVSLVGVVTSPAALGRRRAAVVRVRPCATRSLHSQSASSSPRSSRPARSAGGRGYRCRSSRSSLLAIEVDTSDYPEIRANQHRSSAVGAAVARRRSPSSALVIAAAVALWRTLRSRGCRDASSRYSV